ncbi:MAG: hypothetical protein ABH950_09850 [Candidatus Altiarchaeota archaeon]
MNKIVYLRTFGCQMNVRDSEALCGLLRDAGFVMSDSPEDAGVILFNTCSVRQHAEERIWSALGRLKKKGPSLTLRINHPDKKIIGVIGCMAQNYKDEIFKRMPDVDLVAGPNDLLSIPILIKNIIKEKSQALAVSTMEREQDFYVSDFHCFFLHCLFSNSFLLNSFLFHCLLFCGHNRSPIKDFIRTNKNRLVFLKLRKTVNFT